MGLLGSKYNTDYAPVIPLDKLVVDLNIDMIGRSRPIGDTEKANETLTGPDTIYVIGADRISKELHQLHERVNARTVKLTFDYTLNDPAHPEKIYYRSDHWNYAKHGVPIIFYFDGVHQDYHRPTDTIDKIDFNKMTKVTKLVYEMGWNLGNLPNRPKKD
jgi:Zn-dependent M28 family amino/carboxypeptidase